MGWSIGYDDNWKRDIGYGVPATCDAPGCGRRIDRGISYVCGGDIFGGDDGCGLYFCSAHLQSNNGKMVCRRCADGAPPYIPKPDLPEWVQHKLKDRSWLDWRVENTEIVKDLAARYATPAPIDEFSGEYRFLSNFYLCGVVFQGRGYCSVENAYQAAKFYPEFRPILQSCPPGTAKRLGKTAVLPKYWEKKKAIIMMALLKQKFAPGTPLAERLLATGTAQITEGNTWGDTFWGVCRGEGRNVLGGLLMKIRKDLVDTVAVP